MNLRKNAKGCMNGKSGLKSLCEFMFDNLRYTDINLKKKSIIK